MASFPLKPSLNSIKEPEHGFSGVLEQVPLAELIQFICLEGRDRRLLIRHGRKQGKIYFSNGQVVHAVSPEDTGTEAFFSIMKWNSGTFILNQEGTDSQTIEMPWNFLVMEALRRMDEGNNEQETGYTGRPPVRVLIVDDSPFFCKTLRRTFESMDHIEVIGQASNGQEALVLIQDDVPDLVTLDINMPVMAGDLTLKHIMIRSPAPVLLISGLSESNLPLIMDFMRLGAVDFVPKPRDDAAWEKTSKRIAKYAALTKELKIKNIRRARTLRPVSRKSSPGPPSRHLLIIIGGAGGLLEIQKLLPRVFSKGNYACLMIQDMDTDLTSPVAEYLNSVCRGTVAEIKDPGLLAQGVCWLAGMDRCFELTGTPGECVIQQTPGGKSPLDIENLLSGAADFFGPGLYVILLSGADVAREGLAAVRKKRGRVYVQKPETCLHPAPLEAVLESGLSDGFLEPGKVEDILPEIDSYEDILRTELLNGLHFMV